MKNAKSWQVFHIFVDHKSHIYGISARVLKLVDKHV